MADEVYDETVEQSEEHSAGRYVYGQVFMARIPYVREHLTKSDIENLMKEMVRLGYDGPKSIRDIKKNVMYPLEYMNYYNQAFVNLFGKNKFIEMARESVGMKGILKTMAKWAGTPEKILERAPDTWSKFYAFGKLETEITGNGKGVIRLINGEIDGLFILYLTNYFEGVGAIINNELKVTHKKTLHKGKDCIEWEIRWARD